MTELGIPVFNTPGANANAVKELVICSLLLASRGIVEGNAHVNNVINVEEGGDYAKISKRIEKDKSMFGGQELTGKTLGVVGLGQIGARVVDAALALGLNVVGYDPALSLEAALMLSPSLKRVDNLAEVFQTSDYITLHVPYIPDVTHHLINAAALNIMKPNVHIMNFARGEIVDGAALKVCNIPTPSTHCLWIFTLRYQPSTSTPYTLLFGSSQFNIWSSSPPNSQPLTLHVAWDSGAKTGKYVSDFSDPDLMNHPRHIVLPHLGASTEEAEENSASMAADTIKSFLETGSIRHSTLPSNFLTTLHRVPAKLCPYADANDSTLR
eukprot:1024010-Prorocentrum_minimum.AAC.3